MTRPEGAKGERIIVRPTQRHQSKDGMYKFI